MLCWRWCTPRGATHESLRLHHAHRHYRYTVFLPVWLQDGRNIGPIEMAMISDDSILRQLPPELDRKQVLFLDGVRHTGEIADLAHQRLKSTLTQIATQDLSLDQLRPFFTSAYLDAWALIDVIDRFRALWSLMPYLGEDKPANGDPPFSVLVQPIRDVRNVSDHLAQRVDYVLARRGAALGSLSWFTMLDKEKLEGVVCAIIPGTVSKTRAPMGSPAGKILEFPTGYIRITAGEHTANISEVLPAMEARIAYLEQGIRDGLKEQNPTARTGADMLIRMAVSFGQPSLLRREKLLTSPPPPQADA